MCHSLLLFSKGAPPVLKKAACPLLSSYSLIAQTTIDFMRFMSYNITVMTIIVTTGLVREVVRKCN